MTDNNLFGSLASEKLAEEKLVCRQIVREVVGFGVSQHQLINIIYLLSLNLENVDTLKAISSAIKEASPQSFVMNVAEMDE